MSKLIILRGNSGTGKSTVAKKLQHAMGDKAMLVPQDTIRREIMRVKDGPNNPSIQLIYDTAMYGNQVEYDVVVEGVLNGKNYGDMLRKLASNFTNVYVYYFDISFEETLRRHKTKHNSHEFGEVEMRKWWIDNDLLGVTNEVAVTESLSEDEIVQLILNNLK